MLPIRWIAGSLATLALAACTAEAPPTGSGPETGDSAPKAKTVKFNVSGMT